MYGFEDENATHGYVNRLVDGCHEELGILQNRFQNRFQRLEETINLNKDEICVHIQGQVVACINEIVSE
jgi:hypothetical protein